VLTLTIGRHERTLDESNNDTEETLLEARRKRLLRQGDWAGLTRSKPAELRFPSAEEKRMIGKRRKIKDHRVQALATHLPVSPRQREAKNRTRGGPYMSGALPIEDISIRLGSDALTSTVPRPMSSTESSDTMLFDHEDVHAAPMLQPAAMADHDPHALVGAQPEMWGEELQSNRQASDCGKVSGLSLQDRGLDVDQRKCFQEEDRISGCYIAQAVGGVTRPLRLVVDRTSDPPPSFVESVAVQSDAIGVTNHANAPANADGHQNGNALEQSGLSNGMALPQIVDDGPWKSFLQGSSDSSSMSSSADALKDRELAYKTGTKAWKRSNLIKRIQPLEEGLYHSAYQYPKKVEDNSKAWSQHATQGDVTHISRSSSVSTSLPSITRYNDRPHDGDERGKQWDEDEQLWEDEFAASTTRHDNAAEHEATASTFASCNAVRSFSSTPFSLFGRTSCIGDSVQDAATRAPLSTPSGSMLSRITSPADRSVSRASIQNNVSCDTPSP
jgi:hypothetical protein